MKRNKTTPFAEAKTGELFVKVTAIMNPLIPYLDGLSLVFFGKGKTAYLKIDDALGWCKEEMKYHSKEKYEAMISIMERLIQEKNEESS